MRWKRALTLLPAAVLLGFFLGGLLLSFVQSLGYIPALSLREFSFRYYEEIISSPVFGRSLLFTLKMALLSATFSLFLGALIAIAFLYKRRPPRFFPYLPIAVPHIVLAFLLSNLLGQSGYLSRLAGQWGLLESPGAFPLLVQDPWGTGIIVAYVLKQAPYVASVVYILLRRADRSYWESAASLGAGPLRVLGKVSLPLSASALRFAFFVVLAFDMGAYEIPFLLGATSPRALPVLSELAFSETDLRQRPRAMAYTMLLTVVGLLLILFLQLFLRAVQRRKRTVSAFSTLPAADASAAALPGAGALSLRLIRAAAILLPLLSLLLLGFLAFARRWPWPQLLPSGFTLRGFRAVFTTSGLTTLLFSLLLSLAAALLTAAIALPVAGLLQRSDRSQRMLLSTLCLLPVFVPSTAYYIGLEVLYLQLGIADQILAVLLSHCILIFPYAVFPLAALWQQLGERYTEAAAGLGASSAQAFWRVQLPLLRPALRAAAGLGFIVSFGDYFLTLMVGGGRVRTFALLAVPYMQNENRSLAAAASFVFVLICAAVYAFSNNEKGR